MSDRDALVEVLGAHRWKDMGIDWCSCECGAILRGDASLTGFPADNAFREHVADAILALMRPSGLPFTRERIRAELIDSLPPNPKSAIWVDGVLDRLEAES